MPTRKDCAAGTPSGPSEPARTDPAAAPADAADFADAAADEAPRPYAWCSDDPPPAGSPVVEGTPVAAVDAVPEAAPQASAALEPDEDTVERRKE